MTDARSPVTEARERVAASLTMVECDTARFRAALDAFEAAVRSECNRFGPYEGPELLQAATDVIALHLTGKLGAPPYPRGALALDRLRRALAGSLGSGPAHQEPS